MGVERIYGADDPRVAGHERARVAVAQERVIADLVHRLRGAHAGTVSPVLRPTRAAAGLHPSWEVCGLEGEDLDEVAGGLAAGLKGEVDRAGDVETVGEGVQHGWQRRV